jgi:hypothetical protein
MVDSAGQRKEKEGREGVKFCSWKEGGGREDVEERSITRLATATILKKNRRKHHHQTDHTATKLRW